MNPRNYKYRLNRLARWIKKRLWRLAHSPNLWFMVRVASSVWIGIELAERF